MITVLIVEDNPEKEHVIRNEIEPLVSTCGGRLDSRNSLVTAREALASAQYDLVILDLVLPNRSGDQPESDGGISLLNEIAVSRNLLRPGFVVGLTSFTDILAEQKNLFEKHLWSLIRFDIAEAEWAHAIKDRVRYVIDSHSYFVKTRLPRYDYDVAIIAALHRPELTALLDHSIQWQPRKVPGRITNYYECQLPIMGAAPLRTIAAAQPQMGVVASCNLVSEIVHIFRPRLIVMVGICAGVATDRQNPTDIIFAEEVLLHDSGRIEDGRRFSPDPKTVQVSRRLLGYAKDPYIQRGILGRINASLATDNCDRINLHVGPVASGNAVIACGEAVKDLLSRYRKLQGIEMEGYGIGFACENSSDPKPDWILVKGICDFADNAKDDRYQNRAAKVSMRFALEFLSEIARQPDGYFR